jgi:probable HAF family extracellular repeat protein
MSNAQDINDKGTIVGWSNNTINSNSFSRRAVVWKNGTISDLNNLIPPNSGWELYTAQAINNRGQIVGNGRHNGAIHSFLLTPAKKPQ